MMAVNMAARRTRSISGPIIWGSSSVALTVALLVGWIYVILKNQQLTQQWVGNLWLLVAGILSFVTIMTVLILFSVFLAKQILENRRQITFVDSVTHELRSPLASIQLGLQTLARKGLGDTQRTELRNMMLDDVERLSAFISDILESTRLETATEGHALTWVYLEPLVLDCIDAVAKRHNVDPNVVTVDVEQELELRTDVPALELILKNLLDNAIKYSDAPRQVTVCGRVDANRAYIQVTDRGVGIPKRSLRRVFDRFYRVDNEDVRRRQGTGLGLYVVKALVKTIGGRLRAQSEGLGTGTTMSIVLPTKRGGDQVIVAHKLSREAHG